MLVRCITDVQNYGWWTKSCTTTWRDNLDRLVRPPFYPLVQCWVSFVIELVQDFGHSTSLFVTTKHCPNVEKGVQGVSLRVQVKVVQDFVHQQYGVPERKHFVQLPCLNKPIQMSNQEKTLDPLNTIPPVLFWCSLIATPPSLPLMKSSGIWNTSLVKTGVWHQDMEVSSCTKWRNRQAQDTSREIPKWSTRRYTPSINTDTCICCKVSPWRILPSGAFRNFVRFPWLLFRTVFSLIYLEQTMTTSADLTVNMV